MRTAWLGVLTAAMAACGCGNEEPAAADPAAATPAEPAATADDSEQRAPIEAEPADPTPGVLTAGDRAPALSATRWFRGEPREAVADGRVTLVEFWATWCGPCIAAMPHISGLAERLGPAGLDVIGVSIDRGESAEGLVEQFLVDRAEIVSFDVMLDDGATSREWFEAAGRSGIPCSFVVAQDGRIAWIGHPMQPSSVGEGYELDRVIEGLLAGTYDLDASVSEAAEAARVTLQEREARSHIESEVASLSAEMGELWSRDDRRGVMEYIDRIVALDPEGSHDLAQRKIEILLYELREPAEALDAAQALIAGPYEGDSSMMLTMAALFSGAADPGPEGRAFAVETAQEVVAMTDGTDPNSLVVLAEAHFASGEPSAAANTMRGAMALVDETSPAYSTYELVLSRYSAAAAEDEADDEPDDEPASGG